MGRWRSILEVSAIAFQENYRFPILEVFAFLLTLGTFVFGAVGSIVAPTNEIFAHALVNSLTGVPLLILMILILASIAFGLGGDIEKGVMQILMSYPLKRRDIFSAKLLSALGVALFLFLGIQVFALFIVAPDILRAYFNVVLLSYLADFSTVILVGMLVFLLALVLKRGGLALIVGIIVYFAFGIFGEMVMFVGWAGSDSALRIYGVIAPNVILDQYYFGVGSSSWVPGFSEVLIYLGVSYFAIILVCFLGYVYFDRRFGI